VAEPGVVPGEQVGAVVTAVRGPDDRVDVVRGRFGDVEDDAGLLVEFDEDDRAVDAVVETTGLWMR
jgi:hypothetical protein